MPGRLPHCGLLLTLVIMVPLLADSDEAIRIKVVGSGSFPNLGSIQATLDNLGENPVHLDPLAGVPFVYIDRLEASGSWTEFGAPMPCVDECPAIDAELLVLAENEVESLFVPYEDSIAIYKAEIDLHEAQVKQQEWEERRGRKRSGPDEPAMRPPSAFPGTFRLRVRYSKAPWVSRFASPKDMREVTSRQFVVESELPDN